MLCQAVLVLVSIGRSIRPTLDNGGMSVILIGGTPGTGKTEVAKILGDRLELQVISLGELALDADCISSHDEERDTSVVDEDCLVSAIEGKIREVDKEAIVEGHYIDLVPYSAVSHVFVLRTHPEVLKHRLMRRGWTIEKVQENVEAEVLGVCQLDAHESFGEEEVTDIDTTELSVSEVVDTLQRAIRGNIETTHIDWMTQLEEEGRLTDFMQLDGVDENLGI
jgi:adenylate kinase